MSRNRRILRFAEAQGSSESALGRNMKKGTLAVKTTTTKSLMALALMFWAHTAWSYTVAGNTYNTTGSQSDVQAAVNAAPDNGTVTVVIPNGTYSWTGNLKINKSVNLAGASATGVTIDDNYTGGYMITATSSSNGNINIYWLNVLTTSAIPSGNGYGELSCDRTEPSNYTVLVHDCTWDSNSDFYFNVTFKANGIVMWNCTFPGSGHAGLTGILFSCEKYGMTGNWNQPDTWGTQDTTGLANSYVENCSFSNGTSSLCNAEDNSRVVWRYNTMTDGLFSSHGQDSAPIGCREMEVYNNTFLFGSMIATDNVWISFNGGVGIAYNNAMPAIVGKTGIQLNVYSINRSPGAAGICQTAWPAARQVGQSWSVSSNATYGNPVVSADGIGAVTEGDYIWGNTGTEVTDPGYVGLGQFPDQCGLGQLIGNYLHQGRDYFVGTAKPGYTPYTYPHPLHTRYALSGAGGNPTPAPTPAAPQNLRVGVN
jgi:hypothetical protein